MTLIELIGITIFWLMILMCHKAYKDNVIKFQRTKILYLEDRLWKKEGKPKR